MPNSLEMRLAQANRYYVNVDSPMTISTRKKITSMPMRILIRVFLSTPMMNDAARIERCRAKCCYKTMLEGKERRQVSYCPWRKVRFGWVLDDCLQVRVRRVCLVLYCLLPPLDLKVKVTFPVSSRNPSSVKRDCAFPHWVSIHTRLLDADVGHFGLFSATSFATNEQAISRTAHS